MIIYFVFLGLWTLGAIQFSAGIEKGYEKAYFYILLIGTTMFVGLREQVGADWETYLIIYNSIQLEALSDALRETDPAYGLFNWIGGQLDWGVYVANLVCAVALMAGLAVFCRHQRNPWLAMTVAFPYLVVVVGMGYTRQAAAIGVVCWALATFSRGSVVSLTGKVLLAALFHKSAILFLPILLAPIARKNLLFGLIGLMVFIAAAALILRSASDFYLANYVQGDYQSSGAAVRVAMNVLAASIWFLLRSKFDVSASERLVWDLMAGLAFLCVVGLTLTSSSVGVDRIALFLIPIQVFVLANIPFHYRRGTRLAVVLAVLAYTISIQVTYFFFASYSYAWVPYKNVALQEA